MHLFPNNVEGSLINYVLRGMVPGAPEREVINGVVGRSTCLMVEEVEAAVGGYVARDASYLQDILTVAPSFLDVSSPVWIEYAATHVERFWQDDELPADLLGVTVGHCFFIPEDEPHVTGVITVLSTGFKAADEAGVAQVEEHSVNIVPHIVFVDREALARSVVPLRPRRIDSIAGRIHRRDSSVTLEGVRQFFFENTNLSQLSGLIVDAGIINDWDEEKTQEYGRQSAYMALNSSISALAMLITAQIDGVREVGMPGQFAHMRKGPHSHLVWQRKGVLRRATRRSGWVLSSRVITADKSGQTTALWSIPH